jgi:hypothetical protein
VWALYGIMHLLGTATADTYPAAAAMEHAATLRHMAVQPLVLPDVSPGDIISLPNNLSIHDTFAYIKLAITIGCHDFRTCGFAGN